MIQLKLFMLETLHTHQTLGTRTTEPKRNINRTHLLLSLISHCFRAWIIINLRNKALGFTED